MISDQRLNKCDISSRTGNRQDLRHRMRGLGCAEGRQGNVWMLVETELVPRDPALRDRVRRYGFLAAETGDTTVIRATPVRSQQFLQLVLEGDHVLRNVTTGALVRSAPATLIGQCTFRKYNLEVSGALRMLFVHFQPGALHAWSGLDAQTLTDNCLDARRVFGTAIVTLLETLAAERDPERGIAIADAWFASRPARPLDEIAVVGRRISDAAGGWRPFAASGLSTRQMQRRFARQVGVTPKLHARLSRLAAVVDMHDAEPALSWTSLAHANGYSDQAHLTREFRAVARDAPSRFRRQSAAEDQRQGFAATDLPRGGGDTCVTGRTA